MAAEFDEHAAGYEDSLEEALRVSGETRDYFAMGRMRYLAGLLQGSGREAGEVLDFGCGTGNGLPAASEWLGPRRLAGADVSGASLEIARRRHPGVELCLNEELQAESFDTVYCNGVIHHVPVAERAGVFAEVYRALRSGGWFAMFENSRWNPATRYVMSRCRFDRDAIPLDAAEGRKWMELAGFRVLGTRYLFVFPAFLRALRPLEGPLSVLPLGTQYVVWGVKA